MKNPIWIFGYGSIIWKTDFPFIKESTGYLHGWVRRFWQASSDHRGTAAAPGRVVTLIPSQTGGCWGKIFLLGPDTQAVVLPNLDYREKGGYERMQVDVIDTSGKLIKAITYRAPEQNEHFLGPKPMLDMAKQISHASGPSGSNSDYLFQLEEALQRLGHPDRHVTMLANKTKGLVNNNPGHLP